jgi:hypothetical protein
VRQQNSEAECSAPERPPSEFARKGTPEASVGAGTTAQPLLLHGMCCTVEGTSRQTPEVYRSIVKLTKGAAQRRVSRDRAMKSSNVGSTHPMMPGNPPPALPSNPFEAAFLASAGPAQRPAFQSAERALAHKALPGPKPLWATVACAAIALVGYLVTRGSAPHAAAGAPGSKNEQVVASVGPAPPSEAPPAETASNTATPPAAGTASSAPAPAPAPPPADAVQNGDVPAASASPGESASESESTASAPKAAKRTTKKKGKSARQRAPRQRAKSE